MKTGAPVSF